MAKLNYERARAEDRFRQRDYPPMGKPRKGISPEAPLCTDCGSYMLKRTSQYGAFWGCSQFPRCTGKQKVG